MLEHECVERSAKVTTDKASKYQVVVKTYDGNSFSFKMASSSSYLFHLLDRKEVDSFSIERGETPSL